MQTTKLAALAALPALILSACVTTSTTSTTWGDPYATGAVRDGHVESIREVVRRQQGDPATGALAGAVIGGILGSAFGGHSYYDRWGYVHHEGSGAGALVGAVGGAMVGAAASQGGSEQRWYEVYVRFDDGATAVYTYGAPLPFQVGDPVSLTPQGLVRR